MICTKITKSRYSYQCGYAVFCLSNVLYITLQGIWTTEGSKSEILDVHPTGRIYLAFSVSQSSCSIMKPTTFLFSCDKSRKPLLQPALKNHRSSQILEATAAVLSKTGWRFALKEEQRGETDFLSQRKRCCFTPSWLW